MYVRRKSVRTEYVWVVTSFEGWQPVLCCCPKQRWCKVVGAMFLMPFSAFSYTSYIFLHFFHCTHRVTVGSHSLLTPVSAARKQRRENKNKQQTPRQSTLNPRSHSIQTSALQTSHTLSHFLECVTPLCGALHSVKNPFFLSFFWFFFFGGGGGAE